MSPGILKAEYFGDELIGGQRPGMAVPLKFLTDLVVLAEHTAEITSGKKNGSGTPCSGNGGFFSKVEAGMGYQNSGAQPAKPDLAVKPVHLAFSRATFTVYQPPC